MNIALDQMLEKSANLLKLIEREFEGGLLKLYLVEIRGLVGSTAVEFIDRCCYQCYSYTYELDNENVLRHYVLVHTIGGDEYNIPDNLDIDLRWLYDEDWRNEQIEEKRVKRVAEMEAQIIATQIYTFKKIVMDIGVANSNMERFTNEAILIPYPALPEHLIEAARKDKYLKNSYSL